MVRAAKIIAFVGALLFAVAGGVELYFIVAHQLKNKAEEQAFAVEELNPFPEILEPTEPLEGGTEDKEISKKGGVFLKKVDFAALPAFEEDNFIEALPSFLHSCKAILKRPEDAPLLQGNAEFGVAGDWKAVCEKMAHFKGDNNALKNLIKQELQPFAVISAEGQSEGLFTGYYEASVKGAFKKSAKYKYPLLGRPADLIEINLADFGINAGKSHFFARVVKDKLVPYFERKKIEKDLNAPVLMWLDNPVDLFILQIQGSGRVLLENGGEVNVGYDASNEKPFTSIGKEMIAAGYLSADEANMPNIRKWLLAHPRKAKKLMNKNHRYIFFKKTKGKAPFGAMGIPLTAGRSMAVDPAYIPLGVPLWLDTSDGEGAPLQRLVLAQDVGSAIKGPVRGDFFWGFGEEAFAKAGIMKAKGTYYVLLPKR
jgi:membrane-bound lytic murein transglycosylase A